MSTHTQSIIRQNVAITDWSADHDNAIATLDEDTTKFTNIELRKDVPTGKHISYYFFGALMFI